MFITGVSKFSKVSLFSGLNNLNDRALDALVLSNKIAVHEALEANDVDRLSRAMQAFFASIPHQWYTKNDRARYEGVSVNSRSWS